MQEKETKVTAATDIETGENGSTMKESVQMPQQHEASFFGSLRFRYGLILAVFLILGGYFLWKEHEAHIVGYLPLILVLGACLGMHFFMHGAHGGHGGDHKDDEER